MYDLRDAVLKGWSNYLIRKISVIFRSDFIMKMTDKTAFLGQENTDNLKKSGRVHVDFICHLE